MKATRIRQSAQNTHFTYDLERRAHDLVTYPVLSPQGATLILYGHDNGVTAVWRGGRRLKPASSSKKHNAPSSKPSHAMVIDSDDDDTQSQAQKKAKAKTSPYQDRAEFEEASDDSNDQDNNSDHDCEITQTLDLHFGVPVLQIAALPMNPSIAEEASFAGVSLPKQKAFFTISCASNDVYLLAIPLTPPSHEAKLRPELQQDLLAGRPGSGLWGESLVVLTGQSQPSRGGLALTLAEPQVTAAVLDQGEDTAARAGLPRFIIASHNHEASGTLRFWEVPLDFHESPTHDAIAPFQIEYLPSPAKSVSFNNSPNTQLLVVSAARSVQIFDFAKPAITPDELANDGPFPSHGSWLVTLYQPFIPGSAVRKPLVDCAWIAHGRALFVLLGDGQWGIWDIDGASPTGSTMLGKSNPGIVGASTTPFITSGYVEDTASFRAMEAGERRKGKIGEDANASSPHTPQTRREILSNAVHMPERLLSTQGGISVTPTPSPVYGKWDETVVLWLNPGTHVCVIPGVMRFWDAQLRRSAGGGVNLFSGSQPTRMIKLTDIQIGLLHEQCTRITALVTNRQLQRVSTSPSSSPVNGKKPVSERKDAAQSSSGLGSELLALGESRLVIIRELIDGPGFPTSNVVLGNGSGALPASNSAHSTSKTFNARGLPSRGGAAVIVSNNSDKIDSIRTLHIGDGRRPRRRLFSPAREDGDGEATQEEADGQADQYTSRDDFGFANALNAAADTSVSGDNNALMMLDDDGEDVGRGDIEEELLDIMEIDQQLDAMENQRENGRKRVLFDGA